MVADLLLSITTIDVLSGRYESVVSHIIIKRLSY